MVPANKLSRQNISSESWAYLLKEVVLILVFLYLFLFNGTAADFVNEPFLKVTFGLLTVTGLAWLIAGQRSRTPLGRPLLLFLGVYFVACLTSIDPRRSLEDFGWLVFIVFLFAICADLVARNWSAELIVKSLIVVGGMILAFVWYDPITWYQRWLEAAPGEWFPSIVYRPPSPNTLAMFLNTLLMITLARLIASRSRLNRVIFAGVIVAALGMLYLTSSRGGWLGTAAGLACLIFLLLHARVIDPRPAWRWIQARPALLVATGVVGVALLVPIGWLLYRQTLHPSHGPLLTSRSQFWGPAIETFKLYPLLGQGPYTFSSSLLRAQTLGSGQIFVHAHSTPLNLLAETGIIGFLAGGVLAFATYRAMARRWNEMNVRTIGLSRDSAVVLGACAALAAYSVHGLFDAFQAEPIGLWLLAVVLGTALGRPGGHRVKDDAVQPVPTTALTAAARILTARPYWVALLIVAGWYNYWLMEPLFRGVEAGNSGQWEQAAAQFERVTQRDPHLAVAWQQYGLAQSILAENGDPAALDKAIAAFERTVTLDPFWALNHANLGALYREKGDLAKARKLMEEAVRRAPDVGLFHLNLGVVAEEQGDAEAAKGEYTLALEQMRWAREGEVWKATRLRSRVKKSYEENMQIGEGTVTDLENAIRKEPGNKLGYIELASKYISIGKLEDARIVIKIGKMTTTKWGWEDGELERLSKIIKDVQEKRIDTFNVPYSLSIGEKYLDSMNNASQYYCLTVFRCPCNWRLSIN